MESTFYGAQHFAQDVRAIVVVLAAVFDEAEAVDINDVGFVVSSQNVETAYVLFEGENHGSVLVLQKLKFVLIFEPKMINGRIVLIFGHTCTQFHPGPLCPTLLRPAGGPPLKRPF
jgi:hypothetical protein